MAELSASMTQFQCQQSSINERIAGALSKRRTYEPTDLAIMLTDRCNANCSFCGVEKRLYWTDLSVEIALDWIDQAHSHNFRTVGFTGGETLIRYADTMRCIERVTELGMQPSVMSNSSYAIDFAAGLRVARDLSRAGVRQLGLSFDKDHLDFIPIQRYENALRSAIHEGISVTLLVADKKSTKEQNDAFLFEIWDRLSDVMRDTVVNIERRGIGRYGNAKGLDKGEFEFKECKDIYLQCLTDTLMVAVNGDIFSCCCFPPLANPFYPIGNVKDTNMTVAIERANHSMVGSVVMNKERMEEIVRKISESKEQDAACFKRGEYTCVCDVCNALFSDPYARTFVSKEYNLSEPLMVRR
jgi:sulfatase maturation enzyme AslB (radical SAM superfamily)